MLGRIFQASSQDFWIRTRRGGVDGAGWASYTLLALFLILVCQLAATTRSWFRFRFRFRFRSSSSFFPIAGLRFAAPVSPSTNALKNPAPSPSADSQIRTSDIVSDLDLKSLIVNLDENSCDYQKWESVIEKRNDLLAYSAKCCKPKDGPVKYLSMTIFENCSAEILRDFYMDNSYRKKWDKTVVEYDQLEMDESHGIEIGRLIKKFLLLTAREYILAWKVWETKDGTFYCFSKECEHPLAPQQKKLVRVAFFRSGWRIRKVPGRNACEIKMVHQEDAGLNVEMAKLAFAKGIWSYVQKMDNALRKYTATNHPPSSLAATALSHIQKVPAELDTRTNISNPPYPEASAASASCYQIANEGGKGKFPRKPSSTLIANGLIVVGGLICLSRGHSNLGTKVAIAYILTKLTKKGASVSQSK